MMPSRTFCEKGPKNAFWIFLKSPGAQLMRPNIEIFGGFYFLINHPYIPLLDSFNDLLCLEKYKMLFYAT